MKRPPQMTFKYLLVQSGIVAILVTLIQVFWMEENPELLKALIFFVIFYAVYLLILCLMYKINPFKKNFKSPYK
ncbi:hypothetical protein EGN73_13390 [Arthrospiribacter ruber]|uniref:Uncharacterized protein n=2 Tax=Arthrospiribacter ruber TaxID=2487934 RepID=A0A951J0Q3_9BACT|nr:hypothetical protein [Arthrospiribacter ruber]